MKLENGNLTLEQVSKRIGVSRTLIRFWEEEFELFRPNGEGYSTFEVARLVQIQHLIGVEGMSFDDAKKELAKTRTPEYEKREMLAKLQRIKRGLTILRDKI